MKVYDPDSDSMREVGQPYRRGDHGRKMTLAPSRGGGVDVTDWTVAELLEELAERDLRPEDVTIEYRSCGSHTVEINWSE